MNRSRKIIPATILAALMLTAAPAQAPAAKSVPFMKGITITEYGPEAFGVRPTQRLLRSLKARGVDTVTLTTTWMMQKPNSNTVAPGSQSYPSERLAAAIRYARKLGMRAIVRPYVDREDDGWRGEIKPTSPTRWFRSYTKFVVAFAKIARKERASGFIVASEMQSLSGAESRWRRVVREVRKNFKGWVSYQANWDEAGKVKWWDALDAISISAYYPVSNDPEFTAEDVAAGWTAYTFPGDSTVRNWQGVVAGLAGQWQRPVLFGEIGYRPTAETAQRPWDTVGGTSRPDAQEIAYEGAFRAWWTGQPYFRGFQWWFTNPSPELLDGEVGADHRPTAGTLAVIQRWYRDTPRG